MIKRAILLALLALVFFSQSAYAADGIIPITINGRWRCSCAQMPDGCYTAKHCFAGVNANSLRIGGQRIIAYSLDPTRDLAHIPMFANPNQSIGGPHHQPQTAEWHGLRDGYATWIRHEDKVTICGETTTWDLYDLDGWCYTKGVRGVGEVNHGDSGGGIYVNGSLVGIISLFDPDGCGLWTTEVP